jgi:secreted trypsin-like serine protease
MSFVTVSPVSYASRVLKIRGGTDASPGQFPYQVGISFDNDFVCGGSILNAFIILTAAHCVYQHQREISKFKVTAGDFNRSALEGTEQTSSVSQIAVHKLYNPNPPNDNDIALLLLESPFKFNRNVSSIAWRNSSENYEGTCMLCSSVLVLCTV